MSRHWNLALAFALIAGSAWAYEDVSDAVTGTVKSIDKGAKTAVVKTSDGAEQTFHFVGRTVSHGASATAQGSKDALVDIKEGDNVVVHYSVKGADKTAEEVDHVGKDGLKMSVVAIQSIDRGAKTVSVKTSEGGQETYRMADSAAHETGKGLEKAGKVTVYYSTEAGKKVVHFFKTN